MNNGPEDRELAWALDAQIMFPRGKFGVTEMAAFLAKTQWLRVWSLIDRDRQTVTRTTLAQRQARVTAARESWDALVGQLHEAPVALIELRAEDRAANGFVDVADNAEDGA